MLSLKEAQYYDFSDVFTKSFFKITHTTFFLCNVEKTRTIFYTATLDDIYDFGPPQNKSTVTKMHSVFSQFTTRNFSMFFSSR
jgi:hypothetical protein